MSPPTAGGTPPPGSGSIGADQTVPVKNATGLTSRKNSSASKVRTMTMPTVVRTPTVAARNRDASMTRSLRRGGRVSRPAAPAGMVIGSLERGPQRVLRRLEPVGRDLDVADLVHEAVHVLQVVLDEGGELGALERPEFA